MRETAARHFAGQADLVLVGGRRGRRSARRCATSPRAAAHCFRISTARCRSSAVRWVKPLPLGADGPRVSGAGRVIGLFDRLAAPLLRTLDPERAHALALNALKLAPLPRAAPDDAKLRVQAFGLTFPNPVGLAAGFDKNAEVPDALLRLGFGFVEIGGVTPQPQPGNPRPRLFRLDADEARDQPARLQQRGRGGGARRGLRRARARRASSASTSAPTRTRPTAPPTMWRASRRLAPHVTFLTVNVSSPNTPGLRNLQQAAALDELLARVIDARERAAEARAAPAAAAEDRAGPDAARSRRRGRRRAAPPHRRHDRRQHHDQPAEFARERKGEGAGRAVRPPAVRALDPHAGRDLCARRRRVPADRRRAASTPAPRRSPRSRPARAWCSFIRG